MQTLDFFYPNLQWSYLMSLGMSFTCLKALMLHWNPPERLFFLQIMEELDRLGFKITKKLEPFRTPVFMNIGFTLEMPLYIAKLDLRRIDGEFMFNLLLFRGIHSETITWYGRNYPCVRFLDGKKFVQRVFEKLNY